MKTDGAAPTRLARLLRFLEHDSRNLALRTDAIREACEEHEWSTARELVDTGLQFHAEDAQFLALCGFVQLHGERYQDAERTLSAAVERGVEAAEVRYNLAFAHFMQQQHSTALEVLADPATAEAMPLALLLRARCFHHLQQPDEAITQCRAHLAVSPEHGETHGLLGLLLQEQQRNVEAAWHVDTALKQNPHQLEAMLAQACLLRDAQDYGAAQVSFDRLLAQHPACGRAWLGRGLIELYHLQFDQAAEDITRASAHLSEHIGTWHALAWVELARGNAGAAEAAFQRAYAIDRNFAETHGGLAIIAAIQGREEDARTQMRRAVRLDRQVMSVHYAEMVLLERAGKHEEARAVLDKFTTRPVGGSDQLFRDLVAEHMTYLRRHPRAARARTELH